MQRPIIYVSIYLVILYDTFPVLYYVKLEILIFYRINTTYKDGI